MGVIAARIRVKACIESAWYAEVLCRARESMSSCPCLVSIVDGAGGVHGGFGVPRTFATTIRNCRLKIYVAEINFCVVLQVHRGVCVGADMRERAPK